MSSAGVDSTASPSADTAFSGGSGGFGGGGGGTAFMPRALTLWQAAQQGHVLRVQELITAGANLATDRDPEDVTALHWAAINNHVVIAQFLIEKGAQVDALGGDLRSTPLHWAVRQGHNAMVHALVKAGASLQTRDAQSYNALHLAAQYGHATTCIYLLCNGIDINSLDNDRRTPLMWAVYKGLSDETVEALIRFHSELDQQDVLGCTALHWGAIQGNINACRLLIQAGARYDLQDDKHTTPLGCAESKGRGALFKKMLADVESDKGAFGKNRRKMVMFFVPFVSIGMLFYSFATLPWPLFFLSAAAIGYGSSFLAETLRGDVPIIQTPILAGFFQASVFWCVVNYLLVVLPATSHHTMLNAFILFLLAVAEYLCFLVVTGDPGYVKQGTVEGAKAIVTDLVEQNKLDARHFCTTCLIRKPIRSKHDRVSDRCVAKFDHYCPWVYNVVGYRNQRLFVAYLTCAVLSQFLYFGLAIYYAVSSTPSDHVPTNAYCVLSPWICGLFDLHSMTIITALWCLVNGLWESATLFSQYWTIAYNMTSNEMINQSRYSYLQGGDSGHAHSAGDSGHGHSHGRGSGRTGLNPFDVGVARNCMDFWSDSGSASAARPSDALNFYELYDVPKGDLVKHV